MIVVLAEGLAATTAVINALVTAAEHERAAGDAALARRYQRLADDIADQLEKVAR